MRNKSKSVSPSKALAALRAGLRAAFEFETDIDDAGLLAESNRCADIARRTALASEVEQVVREMILRANGSLTRKQCIEVLKRRGELKIPC